MTSGMIIKGLEATIARGGLTLDLQVTGSRLSIPKRMVGSGICGLRTEPYLWPESSIRDTFFMLALFSIGIRARTARLDDAETVENRYLIASPPVVRIELKFEFESVCRDDRTEEIRPGCSRSAPDRGKQGRLALRASHYLDIVRTILSTSHR